MRGFLKITAILVLTSISIVFAGCKSDEESSDWRTTPTAIVSSEMALVHVAELLELSEDLFFTDDEAGEITAVTAESSRITGFPVYATASSLWNEDVEFFLVTRDYRVYYNIGGEEVRAGVPLVSLYEDGVLTEREPEPEPEPEPDVTDEPDEPDVGNDAPGVPSDEPDVGNDAPDVPDTPDVPDEPDVPSDEPTPPPSDDGTPPEGEAEPDGIGGLGDLPFDGSGILDWLTDMLGGLDDLIDLYGDVEEWNDLELLNLLGILGLYELFLFGG